MPRVSAIQAGTVAINGATYQPRITCQFDAAGGVYLCDFARGSDLWEPSDPLFIAATGAASFSYFTLEVAAPSNVIMLTDLEGLTPDRLNGMSGLHLEWYPGTGTITVEITAMTATGETALICSTDDDGAFDIPAEGLMSLRAPGEPLSWTIDVYRGVQAVNQEERDGQVSLTVRGTRSTATIPVE